MLSIHFPKYFSANLMKVGQLGRVGCPPKCCLKAMSPLVNGVPIGGITVVPKSFLPRSLYTGPAATAAKNCPLSSIQLPSTLGELQLINTGRGAHIAINSCASTGRSFSVNGPEYFIKLGANQCYPEDEARLSTFSPNTRSINLAPPAPEEPINPIAKRLSQAIATNAALPYLERPSIPARFASTSLSVPK